jgi:hypothetical protein
MSTLMSVMDSTYDEKVDELVEKYKVDSKRDPDYCVGQTRQILAVLDYIETVDWINEPPAHTFEDLLFYMRYWFYA